MTSKKGLVAEKGEVVFLQENTDNDAETVEGWAEMLAEGLSEEDEDLLWESSGSTSSGGGNASNGGNSSNGGSTSTPPVAQILMNFAP